MQWICDGDNAILVDEAPRYKSLERDWFRIAKQHGIEKRLNHLNASNYSDFSCHYSLEARELVAAHFKVDLETFNYSFD